MADLHLSPFAPNLSQLVHSLEVDLRGFVKNLPSAVDVVLRLSGRSAFLIELGEIDV